MTAGKRFELFVRKILLSVGFSSVISDGTYIYNGPAGQMIQGLGQSHNADVLMMPPVQMPFYFPSRLLLECKNHISKINLDIVRSALGLREDINCFEVVDQNVLLTRRNPRRGMPSVKFDRYYHQVGVAACSDFTVPAQEYALAHRIPLISFNKLPFWPSISPYFRGGMFVHAPTTENVDDAEFEGICDNIAERMAMAMLDDGQMLFLYNMRDEVPRFESDYYRLYWANNHAHWYLDCSNQEYAFQLPNKIQEMWVTHAVENIEIKRQHALLYKEAYMSHMVVYYREYGLPKIKMLSIDFEQLKQAKSQLK